MNLTQDGALEADWFLVDIAGVKFFTAKSPRPHILRGGEVAVWTDGPRGFGMPGREKRQWSATFAGEELNRVEVDFFETLLRSDEIVRVAFTSDTGEIHCGHGGVVTVAPWGDDRPDVVMLQIAGLRLLTRVV